MSAGFDNWEITGALCPWKWNRVAADKDIPVTVERNQGQWKGTHRPSELA